jgi:hypothetical protein
MKTLMPQLTQKMLKVLLPLMLVPACRPTETSNLQSLDNMTNGGKLTINKCGHSPDGMSGMSESAKSLYPKSVIVPDQLREELGFALSSVPANLKNAFIELGYRIEVGTDIAKKCNVAMTDTREALSSCLSRKEVQVSADEKAEEITVHINAKAEDIRHATVRSMFLALTKSIGQVREDGGGYVITASDSQEFSDWKQDLTIAVLNTVAGNKTMSLDTYKSLLPDTAQILNPKLTPDQRRSLWTQWEKSQPEKASAFKNQILTEASDSYYCSVDSRKSMLAQFKEAHDLFASQLHPALQKLWTTETSLEVDAGNSSGMSLTWGRGGWFPGRNIIAARQNRMADNYEQTGFLRPRLAGYRRPWDGSGTWVQPPQWGSGHRIGWRFGRQ